MRQCYINPMVKAKHLKTNYTWETRRPHIQDNILFVPDYFDEHQAFSESFLPPDQPISIEFCSGNGEWIIEKAKAYPDRTWVAVEMQFARVRKIWSKSQNAGLKNLFIVCGKAQIFSKFYLDASQVNEIYVNFPDPWPKKRHAKHRLIQPEFVKEMERIASPDATAAFVTDDAPYADQMHTIMQDASGWDVIQNSVLTDSHGPSFFDRLWRGKGRTIRKVEAICTKST